MSEAVASKPEPETNIKETIESILVAFILAFIFRGFVVEAFVIPTGSMAPTLMGAHLRFRCDDCGYEWTVNYTAGGDGDDIVIPSRASDPLPNGMQKVYHAICPNCGYRVQRRSLTATNNAATNPPVQYGDRILVLKYLYLLQKPSRWDVVVFKAPEDPARYDYQQNYIKRLIGRPGETIMLLDGDVYVAPNVEGKDPELSDFVVQTKPRQVQDALWRLVYDNDYFPQNMAPGRKNGTEPAWTQPWKQEPGQSGWTVNGRTFSFDGAGGIASISFDPAANPAKQSLTDWLAYDVTVNQGPNDPPDRFDSRIYEADDNVSDLRLNFVYQRAQGDGPLRASMSKIDRTFVAQIVPGQALLIERMGQRERVLGTAAIKTDLSHPTRIDLVNCDYQVTLRIDGTQVLQTTAEQYHPDVQALYDAFNTRQAMPKPEIRIEAAHQRCTISHLSLWRDVYYMNRRPSFGGASPLKWATPDQFPRTLMRLKSDPPEYFCCGDNSPISGDGRYWETPINLPNENLDVQSGRVPGRFLLGRAFFVYWPAGFRPVDSAPAVVPNFGDMRFIH